MNDQDYANDETYTYLQRLTSKVHRHLADFVPGADVYCEDLADEVIDVINDAEGHVAERHGSMSDIDELPSGQRFEACEIFVDDQYFLVGTLIDFNDDPTGPYVAVG